MYCAYIDGYAIRMRWTKITHPRLNAFPGSIDGSVFNPFIALIAPLAVTFFAACGDGTTAPPPDPPRATTIAVSPATAELAVPGATVQLSAEVLDQNGQVMAGATVTWSSSTAAVATVDGSGLVRDAGPGTATITATAGDASATSAITVASSDRAALVALYNATDGPNWANSENWLTDAALEEWHGVTTDSLGRVVRLELDRNKLTGEIPTELGGLASLKSLSLQRNKLTGRIPAELGGLANLESLDLEFNELTGEIPTEFGGFASLESLDLGSNQLTGEIPAELAELASLERLDLGSNQLTGGIPAEFAELASLGILGLSRNQLTGSIPPELGDLASLRYLYLYDNQLTGGIPTELAELASLRSLGLSGNQLTGNIPAELSQLGSLERLDLGDNQLMGVIPAELGDLANLEKLFLDRNQLTDSIPPEFGGLDSLRWLSLYDNQLTGNIPPELGRLDSLEVLFLHDNSGFAGALPLALASLSALESFWYNGTGLCVPADASFQAWLNAIPKHVGTGLSCAPYSDREILEALYHATDGPNWDDNENWLTDTPLGEWYGVFTNNAGRVDWLVLSANGLSGKIPPELAGLTSLRWLILSINELSGPIPPELGNLANLQKLDLGFNKPLPYPGYPGGLSGEIPPELGNLANLQELHLYANDLSGAIPPELGNLADLESLSLGTNDLSGAIPPWLGSLTNLESLNLGENHLSGAIPTELGDLANLESLYLSRNDLSGAIPPELGDLANLESLYLSRSGLSGAIPTELGDLANLKYLDLSRNGLSGEIPPELGDLANLRRLHLFWNDLSGEIPREVGNLASLKDLDLHNNDLSGEVPPELGNLAELERLHVEENAFSGTIPPTLLTLPLNNFRWRSNSGLCAPGTSSFVEWLDGVETQRGPYCNASDQAVLTSLYEVAGGGEWTDARGWLGGAALDEWHGVETDSLGRVTALDLSDNGLSGGLPGVLGSLGQLTRLRIDGNPLARRLPLLLSRLDLEEFYYDDTDLCEPADAEFRAWLRGIPSRRGTGVQCGPLTEDRNVLVALYEGTGGSGWWNSDGWLSDRPLDEWYGVDTNAQGQVYGLRLSGNRLTGGIPPELGNLPHLRNLSLGWNSLSGAIPPELGNLAKLSGLHLSSNDLSGPIPPELANLTNLYGLALGENNLSGAIPPELAKLTNLHWADLRENDLSGPIPTGLGDLANLERLHLEGNDLSGAVPPTFGGLASLTDLSLSNNAGLAGALPAGLRDLGLESLLARGTDLCVPRERAFEEWLAAIPERRIGLCGEPPAAYLVQAVQSRAHPVPLVAGENALLRVFVTAAMETTEGLPEVRARFYLNGSERHVANIAGSSAPIPTEIDEGDLSKSANAEISGRIVQPGLEMVVEIDPGNVLDQDLGVPKRIPEEGRLAIDVREMPTLDLTVIPFLWSTDPDSAIIGLVDGMATDPAGHDLLDATHVLLPVADIDVTAHAPVNSTSNNAYDLVNQTDAIRVLEGRGGHYMGMMSGDVTGAGGVAHRPGRSSFSVPESWVIAHELGHNMSLGHAPCGDAAGPDPSFPDPTGAIGAWGYDFRRAFLVPQTRKEHMSYCHPNWTSEYYFTKALQHRLADEGASAAALATGPVRSLLLWGGVDVAGTPFLNPAFVADAPPALPDSAGDYAVTGRDANGRELFSLSFAMPVALSEEGEVSSFVFALPARPGWADALASVTLSGPAGTATLDGDSNTPMAILRDPVTSRVRGFLRGVEDPSAVQAAADATDMGTRSLNVLFSRGIPGVAAWRN